MENVMAAILFAFGAFCFGIYLGITAGDIGLKTDCEKMGAHRVDSIVYQCKRVTP